MADIEIEIDGKKLNVPASQTIIQAADDAGIYIPRFCYHRNLSIAANCRMCLVEVEKSPKAVPACATPVMPGMKVFTQSKKTIDAQRAVMEFLLINHPLDCPICDQGGECELQDLSMGYGSSQSAYTECKRAVADDDLGPLIATEMTRCIHCTRCVRFGEEIAGFRELGAIGRGEDTEISTYIRHAMHSVVSGNIIDLCPVGALTSKPFRFTARSFELNQAASVSPHDCVGANIYVHSREGKVMRVVARDNPAVNQMWLADRDRFSYTGLYHAERLTAPMIKVRGEWQTVEWQQAFTVAAEGLQKVVHEAGALQLGALLSPNATLEEAYLLQKLMRALGSPHIDHRLRAKDHADQAEMPLFPGLNMTAEALESCDAIILIGANVLKEQPLLALRLRKAALSGAAVSIIHSIDDPMHIALAHQMIISPQELPKALAAIVQAYESGEETGIAHSLQGKQKICIMLGALAFNHPQASTIRYLAQRLAQLSGATLSLLTDGANAAGAYLAGALPHRQAAGRAAEHIGLDAYAMLEQPRKAYVLFNVEPDCDCANAVLAERALKQAEFVLSLSLYRNPILEKHADVILPIAAFTETAGTFVNAFGDWQSFQGTAQPFAASRPAWKILRVLAEFLHLPDFQYQSAEEIKLELHTQVAEAKAFPASFAAHPRTLLQEQASLMRIGEIPLYATDSLVRRAAPLQAAQVLVQGDSAVVKVHPHTAQHYQLQEGQQVLIKSKDGEILLPVCIDARIAAHAAYIPGAIAQTSELGDLFGPIELLITHGGS